MDKHLSEICELLLGGCLAGITYEKWIEIAAIYKGAEYMPLIFSVSLLTSLFVTAWLVLFMMRSGNRILGQISFGLHLLVVVLWLACVIVTAVGE